MRDNPAYLSTGCVNTREPVTPAPGDKVKFDRDEVIRNLCAGPYRTPIHMYA